MARLAGVDLPREKKVEIGAVWSGSDPQDPTQEKMQAGRMFVTVPKKRLPLAVAAPGLR
jgi:hypothetical protein